MNFQRVPPLTVGLSLSALIHAGFFLSFLIRSGSSPFSLLFPKPDIIEVDLTRPHRFVSDPKLAYKAPKSGTGAPWVPKPTPGVTKVGGGIASKGKDWVTPTTGTKVLEKTIEEGNVLSKSTAPTTGLGTAEGESQGPGGLGTGGEGEVDLVYLTDRPRLLNKEELLRAVRRLYPEEERRAGREGTVGVLVHLNRDGQVAALDIADSDGPLFDEAARKALSLARYAPARQGERAVAVKFKQPILFRLEE